MINLIVAIGVNNLIGKGNDLPWHYSEDLKYFKKTTLNKTVVMGENTFKSITSRLNKPLPKRHSVVCTFKSKSELQKEFEFSLDDVTLVNDVIKYLEENKENDKEIFIIGGMQIYKLALPYASKLYITHILKEYDGDVYFPEIDYSLYELESSNDLGEIKFNVYKKVL